MISDNKTATLSANGILVERTLSVEDGWIVGSIQVESISQQPEVVHVVEELPEALPVESVGFKRDDPPEQGEITADRISVNLPVEDTAVSVEFGIELADAVDEVAFDEPTIERVDAASEPPSVAQTDGGEAPLAEIRDGETATDEPATSAEGSADDAGTEGPASTAAGADSDEAAAQSGAYSTAASVRDVIRQGTDDDAAADGTAPADETDEGPTTQSPRGSVEARLDWLSSRVDEFAAYTSALEAFLDEQGTAQEFMDRIDADVAELSAEIDTVSEELESIRESNQAVGDELRQRTESLEERIEDARRSVEVELEDVSDSVDAEVERVDGTLADHDEELDSLRADYEALEARVDDLEAEIETNGQTIDAIEADVSSVADDVESLRTEVAGLRSDVSELSDFRTSLADVFAGADVDPVDTDE